MNLWRAITDFFASGQRRTGRIVHQPGGDLRVAQSNNPPNKPAITLTTHETGITLEFPMREDRRPILRALAWQQFHRGLFLLVAPLLIYAGCHFFGYRFSNEYLSPVFLAGLVLLAAAANRSSAITKSGYDDDLYQLSVVGKLLVRTSRDMGKVVWYQHEILDIIPSSRIQPTAIANDESRDLRLEVLLNNGEKTIILEWDSGPLDELQWVATQLRLALFPASPIATDNPHATAIRVKDASREETRYTE